MTSKDHKKSCYPERSKIMREAHDLAKSRDVLFVCANTNPFPITNVSS